MADQDRRDDGPSLELPSLRFGRRKKSAEPVEPEQPAAPATEPAAAPATEPAPAVAEPVAEPPAAAPSRPARRARTRRERPRRAPSLPVLGGMAAAVLTGAVIGLVTVGLTWGSQRTCEAARGTSSCGAAGFWLLVAILIAMVLLGAALLRAWRVPDPGSTSFLAVGLLAVLALLFLVDVLFSRWMLLVIPVLTVLTYALAHWVTTTFVEPERD